MCLGLENRTTESQIFDQLLMLRSLETRLGKPAQILIDSWLGRAQGGSKARAQKS